MGVVAKTWYGVAPMCVLEYCAQNIERHELFEAWNRVRYGVFWPKIDFASTSLYTKRVSFGVWGGKMSRGVWGIHLVTLRPVQRLNFIVKIEKMTEFGQKII